MTLSHTGSPIGLGAPRLQGTGSMNSTQQTAARHSGRKLLQMWRAAGVRNHAIGTIVLRNSHGGGGGGGESVNLQHCNLNARPALISVPASPVALAHPWGFRKASLPFVFCPNQTQKFMVADLTGEEWVLPARSVPTAGADRKIGTLLMSSQRKPLMDKRAVVFLPSPFTLPGVFK